MKPLRFLVIFSILISISIGTFAQAQSMQKTLYVGQTLDVTEAAEEVVKSDSLSWSSTNGSVATVSNGIVTAHKKGRALIHAQHKKGDGLRFNLVLTVLPSVKKIILTSDKRTLSVGEELNLEWTVEGPRANEKAHDDVNFHSTNTKVLTVDNKGLLKAVSSGKAHVVIQTKDGHARDQMPFSVEGMVKKVLIDQNPFTLDIGESASLSATVSPENSLNTDVIWACTPELKITNNGEVTGIKEGTGYVSVTTVDGKKRDTLSIEVQSLVSALRLSENNFTLKKGESQEIQATLVSKNENRPPRLTAINWKSNKPQVVSISSNGTATAKSSGIATITATSKDGNKKATCIITVPSENDSSLFSFLPFKGTAFSGNSIRLSFSSNKKYDAKPKLKVYGGRYSSQIEDDFIDFTPYETGTYTLLLGGTKSPSRLTFDVKSAIKGVSIKKHGMEKNTNSGRYVIYLGQKGQLNGQSIPNTSEMNDSLRWKSSDSQIVYIDSNGAFEARGVGRASISLNSKDGAHKETLHMEVLSLSSGVRTPSHVRIGQDAFYLPPVTFIIDPTLRNTHTDVFEKGYTLSVKKLYLPRTFLEEEIAFENERLKEWISFEKKGLDKNGSLKEKIKKSKKRKIAFDTFLRKSKEDFCLVTYRKLPLWNRNHNTFSPLELSKKGVSGTMECIGEIELTTKDGNNKSSFEVQVESSLGNKALVKKGLQWEEVATPSSKSETSSDGSKTKNDNDTEQNKNAERFKKAQQKGFVIPETVTEQEAPISRVDMAKICINLLEKLLEKKLPQTQGHIFIDTRVQQVNQAFQYGIVSASVDRRFRPQSVVTREEMAHMLYKTLMASRKKLPDEKTVPRKFKDINKVNPLYKNAVWSLYVKRSLLDLEGSESLLPHESVSVKEAVFSAFSLLESIE